jgi:protocatechuate 3,4-dioxygenase, alpha subunit
MSSHTHSSSQTVGPFFHDGLMRADAQRTLLATPQTTGERIQISGHVYDGDGIGVPDALIEIWQANHYGRYNHPADQRDLPLDRSFQGFGRAASDAAGCFCFETIKPGRVPFDKQRSQAPHICVAVFARGLLNHLLTRLYFADDPANVDDPVLQLVPAERRATLLAQRAASDQDGAMVYRFDIVLQGAGETVFFNL